MFYEKILAPVCVLGLAFFPPPGDAQDSQLVRNLVSQWNDAYRRMDADALSSLETADVEIVDRFGAMHRPAGDAERRQLWADGFEQMERKSFAPESTVEQVHFVRMGVAIVRLRVNYRDGAALLDGARIPAHSEIHSFLLVCIRGAWRVASISMQDITVS